MWEKETNVDPKLVGIDFEMTAERLLESIVELEARYPKSSHIVYDVIGKKIAVVEDNEMYSPILDAMFERNKHVRDLLRG
ncbi:MAG: hypothetical protein GY928_11205 [Colwellia sp.]|nr:hypothetical protein [Colwellia sp.]